MSQLTGSWFPVDRGKLVPGITHFPVTGSNLGLYETHEREWRSNSSKKREKQKQWFFSSFFFPSPGARLNTYEHVVDSVEMISHRCPITSCVCDISNKEYVLLACVYYNTHSRFHLTLLPYPSVISRGVLRGYVWTRGNSTLGFVYSKRFVKVQILSVRLSDWNTPSPGTLGSIFRLW